MINIAVLGAGSAASVNILAMINAAKKHNLNINITCFYDENIPTAKVGESTSAAVYLLLAEVLDFRILEDLEILKGTVKWGTLYENWGPESFFVHHKYPGLHVDSSIFSDFVLEKLLKKYPKLFTSIPEKVFDTSISNKGDAVVHTSNDSYVFDYIIDCRGHPCDNELNTTKFTKCELQTVNSVILKPFYGNFCGQYTTSIAARDGWIFKIPLTNRLTYGYLYNDNITNTAEARENFSEFLCTDIENCRELSWTPFHRKNIIENKIMYSGNQLFFFEPSQGFPLHYYIIFADKFIELLNSRSDLNNLNLYYQSEIEKIQDVIALTYAGRNDFNTEFWKTIRVLSTNRIKNSQTFKNWYINKHAHYASHPNEIMMQIINGIHIDMAGIFK